MHLVGRHAYRSSINVSYLYSCSSFLPYSVLGACMCAVAVYLYMYIVSHFLQGLHSAGVPGILCIDLQLADTAKVVTGVCIQ